MSYTDEDLEIDVAWLNGYGIESDEAESFIKSLLDENVE